MQLALQLWPLLYAKHFSRPSGVFQFWPGALVTELGVPVAHLDSLSFALALVLPLALVALTFALALAGLDT